MFWNRTYGLEDNGSIVRDLDALLSVKEWSVRSTTCSAIRIRRFFNRLRHPVLMKLVSVGLVFSKSWPQMNNPNPRILIATYIESAILWHKSVNLTLRFFIRGWLESFSSPQITRIHKWSVIPETNWWKTSSNWVIFSLKVRAPLTATVNQKAHKLLNCLRSTVASPCNLLSPGSTLVAISVGTSIVEHVDDLRQRANPNPEEWGMDLTDDSRIAEHVSNATLESFWKKAIQGPFKATYSLDMVTNYWRVRTGIPHGQKPEVNYETSSASWTVIAKQTHKKGWNRMEWLLDGFQCYISSR